MTESTETPTSPIVACPPALVEPLNRQNGSKESQPRETTLSATASTAGASEGTKGSSSAPRARIIAKQQSTPLSSPASHLRPSGVHLRAGACPGSPSRFHSVQLREHESGSGPLSPTKRSPIRVGYLFKQSSGSWKRKRWNQRWFVLDNETGILKYFRHESLLEAVPFRQDAHAVIYLREPGASLVIQGDLPRNVPTPFCFTICDASRSFLICADTNQDFREWTSAIAAILSPRKTSMTEEVSPIASETPPKRAATDSALHQPIPYVRPALTVMTGEILSKPMSPGSNRTSAKDEDTMRPSLRQTLEGLCVINLLFAIVRYGSFEWLSLALVGMNAFLIWVLFLQERPPRAFRTMYQSPNEIIESVTDDSSSELIDPLRSATPDAVVDSPRIQAALPRIEKQLPKFVGMVNGAKAKAGDSVKMCLPAPAAFIPGCWTQISGTRYQVRQGPNYRKTKLKAASDESLLELVAVDIYRSSSKIDNIASLLELTDLKPAQGPLDLFVVNCQVPSYQPSNPIWGEKQGDGEGFNFVSYFAIPPSIREQLDQSEPGHQAVRLLKNFMKDDSTVRDRFKAIGIVVNPQEQKLGRTERHLLETYNGQPILTRPQHRFYRGDGYFEVDVDAHEFNFVARKGLVGVSEHFRNMVVDFGYVVEGQEDTELPEQMLGAVRLCKIDVRQALEIS